MSHTNRDPSVIFVGRSAQHAFSKNACTSISLLAGLGVEGDAHCGATVQHLSRLSAEPPAANLRQVHLLQAELLEELRQRGFDVGPGVLGENITTSGLDLLGLPRDTLLRLGPQAAVRVTGLRNPCAQLDGYSAGLTRAVLERSPSGELIRKCGIMSIVEFGGAVRPGDGIAVELPDRPHRPLECV